MTATARHLAKLTDDARRAALGGLTGAELAALEYEWRFWARPDQLPPDPALWPIWRTWILLGGRGSGKTRSAAEWVRAELESGRRRSVGIIGPTAAATRGIMVEGISGLLNIGPPDRRPSFEPSTRKLVYPNGGLVHTFSAEEPDRLRGPNLDGLWTDEICAMANGPAVWDMANMALRIPGPLGHAPQAVISTTPKPSKLLRAILAAPTTVTTRARTSDNAAHLDASTLQYYHDRYSGSRLGRQELDAELLQDVEGALWSAQLIDAHRRDSAPAEFTNVVIGVDPSGGGSAETGIIIAGLGADKHGYIVGDASMKGSPQEWGARAIEAYHLHQANRIVCEKNFGGEMCRHVLASIDRTVPVRLVTASRGKRVRAEPVVSLYEQGRIHHVGQYPVLEDQLTQWDPLGNDLSPDRLDALVWACSELMVTGHQPWTQQSLNSFWRGERPGEEMYRRDYHISSPWDPNRNNTVSLADFNHTIINGRTLYLDEFGNTIMSRERWWEAATLGEVMQMRMDRLVGPPPKQAADPKPAVVGKPKLTRKELKAMTPAASMEAVLSRKYEIVD